MRVKIESETGNRIKEYSLNKNLYRGLYLFLKDEEIKQNQPDKLKTVGLLFNDGYWEIPINKIPQIRKAIVLAYSSMSKQQKGDSVV